MRMSISTSSPELINNGVHLFGDFVGRSGISRAGRDLLDIVQGMGLPTEVMDIALSPERHKGRVGMITGETPTSAPQSRLSIAHCNADSLAYVAGSLPPQIFADRRIIGVWYWESEVLPESHRRGFDWVDEVWVTSRFIAENLAKSSPVPVRHFPTFMPPVQPPAVLDLPDFLQNDRFVFLFCFDYRSLQLRKNPHGVCEAFVRAFPTPEPGGPLCIIKSFMGKEQFALQALELKLQYRHRPDIVFIDEWFTTAQRDSLMARANCYVSLHRSEGLGLTLLESMSLGKPCIATAYSGNMDFMTDENSWLVPAQLVPIGPGVPPFPPNDLWAEPDTDSAVSAMRAVFDDPAEARLRGERARRTVLELHSREVVGNRVAQLLQDAIKGPAKPKPVAADPSLNGTASATARAKALELLKVSKSEMGQVKELVEGRKLNQVAKLSTGALLNVVRTQQKALAEALKEMGELKKRLKALEEFAVTRAELEPGTLTRIVEQLAGQSNDNHRA